MPSRPHHEVYQTQMLKKLHGFPQFNADPEGNGSLRVTEGVKKIEIGDVGHFQEGRFTRITSLDLQAICGPNLYFDTETIPMGSPERAGNIKMIAMNTGISVAPGALAGIAFGGGPNIRLKCVKGEGAILNVQTGRATYTRCDIPSKMLLGEHMLKNYKQWVRDAPYLEPEDLFLVTGTYMTRNWEAATFRKDTNTSIGFDVTVDAVLLEGSMSIDWKTWRNGERGFRHGHTHLGQIYPNHNTVPSFGACCSGTSGCLDPPENQCIFLRGWRVKDFDLVKSRMAYFSSVQSTENDKLPSKRGLGLFRKSPSASFTKTKDSSEEGSRSERNDTPTGSDQHLVANLVEAEGTPIPSGCADIYDIVATTKFHSIQQQGTIVLHDDEVIDYFTGSAMDLLVEGIKGEQSDLKPTSSHPLDLQSLVSGLETDHELGRLSEIDLKRELPETYEIEEVEVNLKKAEKRPMSRKLFSGPSFGSEGFKDTEEDDTLPPYDVATTLDPYQNPMPHTSSQSQVSGPNSNLQRSSLFQSAGPNPTSGNVASSSAGEGYDSSLPMSPNSARDYATWQLQRGLEIPPFGYLNLAEHQNRTKLVEVTGSGTHQQPRFTPNLFPPLGQAYAYGGAPPPLLSPTLTSPLPSPPTKPVYPLRHRKHDRLSSHILVEDEDEDANTEHAANTDTSKPLATEQVRKVRACTPCRTLKEKCEPEENANPPACRRCVKAKRECVYPTRRN